MANNEASGGRSKADDQSLVEKVGEAGGSVAETVVEIKDKVVEQVSAVAEKIDLRERIKRNPVAWTVGAVAVGVIVGPALYRAAKGNAAFDRLREEIADLGDAVVDEISWVGDSLADGLSFARPKLVPLVAGAALPFVARQISDAFGYDLTPYLTGSNADRSSRDKGQRSKSTTKGKKKKNGGKKR